MANRYDWSGMGQDEQNIVGSRLADQIHNRLGLVGISMAAQRDIALVELLARRWEIDFTSVMSFGAIGDGLADDTKPLRDAVEAAGEGGTILIPRDKAIRLTETVLLKQGQTLTGGGTIIFDPGQTVAAGPISNEGCTTATGYTAAGNITITDITIESETGNGLTFAHCNGLRVLGVRFTKWYWHCVDLTGCKNVVIGDCYAQNEINPNNIGSAFQVDQAQVGGTPAFIFQGGVEIPVYLDDTPTQDVVIRNNLIDNQQSYAFHLHRSGHSNIAIIGNIARGCTRGFQADGGETYEQVSIVGNQFETQTGYGIAFEATGIGIKIADNVINDVGSSYGIWVRSTDGPARDVAITGNVITNFGFAGIRIEGVGNFTIANNAVYNPTGPTKRGIVVVNAGAGSVTGNSVDCAIEMGGTGDTPGIYVVRDDGGTNRNIEIAGNQVQRCVRGIWVTNNSENLSIIGNTIATISDRGILLGNGNGTYTFTGCAVNGNAVRTFNRSGIVIEKPSRCAVTGNTVQDCIGDGVNGRGIQLFSTGEYNTVVGNVVDGVNKATGSVGILIGCTYTIVGHNAVTGWATGLGQDGPGLAGVIYLGNLSRDNTVDSGLDLGSSASEQRAAFNWLTNQGGPMIVPAFQINDTSGGCVLTGSGDPEGNVSTPTPALYIRTAVPGFLQAIYAKVSNPGDPTGWRPVVYLNAQGHLATPDDAWNAGHFVLGAYHLWVDGSGRLRIKNGAPSSDTDGTVVGTQS